MLPFLLYLVANFNAGSIPIIGIFLYLLLTKSIAALVAVLQATTIALTFFSNKDSTALNVRVLTSSTVLTP
ncbi:Uncharacterised protein [Clostridioides difficile]|nr:Uncharacterised protein [Clostridioides difficile]